MEDQKALSAVQSLNITNRHLVNLRARFDEIDLDASGSIDAEEFFEMLQETRSPFTDALFRLIDLDGSGTIEFGEYIQVMITYCIFTKTEILRCAEKTLRCVAVLRCAAAADTALHCYCYTTATCTATTTAGPGYCYARHDCTPVDVQLLPLLPTHPAPLQVLL